MFGRYRVMLLANQANTVVRNIKCGIVNLSHVNGERFLGVQVKRNLMFAHAQKGREVAPSIGKKLIHNSTPSWSNLKGKNQRKEEMKNYIFLGILTMTGLSLYIFSTTMRYHEDYVFIDPKGKKG